MTIMLDVAGLAEAAKKAADTALSEKERAAEASAKAQLAADRAAAARQAAEDAEWAGIDAAAKDLLGQMRALTAGVRAKFDEAEAAIDTAPHQVLGLWIIANTERAEKRGIHDVLAEQYVRLPQRNGQPRVAPPGSWGWANPDRPSHTVSGDVVANRSLPGGPQGFDAWLTSAIDRRTKARRQAAAQAARAALTPRTE